MNEEIEKTIDDLSVDIISSTNLAMDGPTHRRIRRQLQNFIERFVDDIEDTKQKEIGEIASEIATAMRTSMVSIDELYFRTNDDIEIASLAIPTNDYDLSDITSDGTIESHIFLTYQMEGFHQYKNCPHDDVAFIRDMHRHIFHFRVKMQVFHDDREVEFIRLKRECQIYTEVNILPGGHGNSCEHMARQLFEYLNETYGPKRAIIVEVAEDGENGGIIEYTPWLDLTND